MAISPLSVRDFDKIFDGTKEISDRVRDFFNKASQAHYDPSSNINNNQVNTSNLSRDNFLREGLAPSFGTLDKNTVQNLDGHLKVIISGVIRELRRLPPEERTWDRVISVMMQSELLELDGDEISRADKLIKPKQLSAFRVDGRPDESIVQEVNTWFVNLIQDPEVLDFTSIKIEDIGKIVAQSGAAITSFETFFGATYNEKKTVVDIGIMRFPQLSDPHFKVYRIQLIAWAQSQRILFLQEDSNGITGEYRSRKFKPSKNFIDPILQQIEHQAQNDVLALFNDL